MSKGFWVLSCTFNRKPTGNRCFFKMINLQKTIVSRVSKAMFNHLFKNIHYFPLLDFWTYTYIHIYIFSRDRKRKWKNPSRSAAAPLDPSIPEAWRSCDGGWKICKRCWTSSASRRFARKFRASDTELGVPFGGRSGGSKGTPKSSPQSNVRKWYLGKWNQRLEPAVCPSCLILSHTHMAMGQIVPPVNIPIPP